MSLPVTEYSKNNSTRFGGLLWTLSHTNEHTGVQGLGSVENLRALDYIPYAWCLGTTAVVRAPLFAWRNRATEHAPPSKEIILFQARLGMLLSLQGNQLPMNCPLYTGFVSKRFSSAYHKTESKF